MLGNQAFACTPAKKSLKLSSIMKPKRLILAIVVAFVVLWVTDFLIHGVWMMPDYRGTQQLWRTDAAMGSRMGWMLGAQLLFAITFVLLWTRWADTARLGCAIGYGFLIDLFLERCRGKNIDKVVGIDARGFLFGSTVAYELGVGFVPIRKRGKLPYKTEIAKYSLEYGEAEMEMHVDAMMPGERVVLVDDLLATGGTSAAATALIRKVGGQLLEAQFLIELEFLHGRKQLEPTPVVSFLKY